MNSLTDSLTIKTAELRRAFLGYKNSQDILKQYRTGVPQVGIQQKFYLQAKGDFETATKVIHSAIKNLEAFLSQNKASLEKDASIAQKVDDARTAIQRSYSLIS